MKQAILGLLGGMSWESTAHYYAQINQHVRAAKGGLHSAPILLHSVDFADIAAMQQTGDWAQAAALLGDAACGPASCLAASRADESVTVY